MPAVPSPVLSVQPAEEDIRAHLAEILADRRFISAERNASFLRYVVERTLEGKAEEVKETVIAGEVYGRTADYDPKSDSIVRVEATRLRQKLRAYYENEGRNASIRIHLPSGTYVPRFELNSDAAALQPETAAEPENAARGEAPPAVDQAIQHPASQRMAWAGIAAAVIAIFSLQLAGASRATDVHQPEAVAAWQEAVALLNQDPHTAQTERGAPSTLVRAVERAEFAVARDPNFAQAWTTLAEAYDYVFPYVGRDQAEDIRRAETAAKRAVTLDSSLSAGHHMLGLVQFMLKWEFTAAERSYQRALELDPNNVYAAIEYADLLRETGRTHQAAEVIRKSRALLPGLPQLTTKEAEIQLELGHPGAAVAAAENALHLNRSYLRAHLVLGMAEEMAGKPEAALKRYEYLLSVDPADRRALPAYGFLLARMGRHDQAREIARRLEDMNATVRNCAFQVAVVYAGLKEYDRSLDWLERAWRTHQVHFPFAVVEPRLGELHSHPRFKQMVSRIGLSAGPTS